MTKLEAVVQSLYVGVDPNCLVKAPRQLIQVELPGIVGDKHSGYTRLADSRDKQYPRGTEIRNWRQWSAVSAEELEIIAKNMGIPKIDPAWLGANLCLAGIPTFTLLSKGSTLTFSQGVVLEVEKENFPCIHPGKVIATQFYELNIDPSLFIKASMHLRGLVGVVNMPGTIRVGDYVQVSIAKY
jgi:MOSC domain-containing protein YiiM